MMVDTMGRKTRTLPKAALVALVSVVLLGTVTPIHAQGLDPASAAALAETLKALANPNGGSLPLGTDAAAAEIDRQVKSIAGSPQLTQEVYNLAARVLAELVQSTGGDVRKLSDALERARSDPEGFAATLSPPTLQQLRELSDKIGGAKR